MSESVPICTHIKTDGVRCGSPAVSGTALCYHHSVVKTTLDKVPASGAGAGQFEPIPFLFAEDRASLQINYFLLLKAFNEHRVDLRTFKAMMSILRSMAANLGKSGSLVDRASDQRSAVSEQREGNRQQAIGNSTQRPPISKQETANNIALSAAAESRRGEEDGIAGLFSVSPDYGCLPSLMPWAANSGSTGADSFRMMARQAARRRW